MLVLTSYNFIVLDFNWPCWSTPVHLSQTSMIHLSPSNRRVAHSPRLVIESATDRPYTRGDRRRDGRLDDRHDERRPSLRPVTATIAIAPCMYAMWEVHCRRAGLILIGLLSNLYHYRPTSNPGTRVPGFEGRQTRKPGFEKYPPGLHSLLLLNCSWHLQQTATHRVISLIC